MFRPRRLSAVGSFSVGGPGSSVVLGTVNVGVAAASAVVKVYNGTSAAGTQVAQIDATTTGSYGFLVTLDAGLFVDLSGGNADVTVGYA